MLKRVAVVGAESTGTTTLARALADRLGAPCVPEYGREYALRRVAGGAAGQWRTHDDFVHIAERQAALEDAAARAAGSTGLLVCDTTPLMVCVYEERYLGSTSPRTEAAAAGRRYALTILTLPDFPLEPDPIRDDGMREWMTARLRDRARPDLELSGPPADRLSAAIAAIGETGRGEPTGREPQCDS